MKNISYRYFILEAIKITIFCLLVTGFFTLIGSSNADILIVFNMAVISAAATFSPEKKALSHVMLGSTVVVLSIILGGLAGFYIPTLARLFSIVYAGLAFLLPKTKIKTNIFVTSAVMFLIFSSLPFNWDHGLQYLLNGIIVIIIFTIMTWVFNLKIHANEPHDKDSESEGNQMSALVAVIALSLAWLISYLLKIHTTMSHLYWVGLTVLVVIQGSQQKNIITAIRRIGVNAFGALMIVLLFNYIMPTDFWINFTALVLFLFLIFALGFSYVGRTLFIEMFVLGFTHLLGSYHNVIALDRVILTTIGGILVIATTLMCHYAFKKI